MKIHAICLVKNEVDIVAYCLESALSWADEVYVFDNGSTDGTWEEVQGLSSDRIHAWKSEAKPFKESLRCEVFNEYRSKSKPGDWWCRLDADEFYNIVDVRLFLQKVPLRFHVVWGTMIEYYLTKEDAGTLSFDVPAQELLPQLKHYKAAFAEPRFFRYRPGLVWDAEGSWPRHVGVVAPTRIPYRHYKYRSPEQIQRRLDTRKAAIADGFEGWGSVRGFSWEDKLVSPESLQVDDGQSELRIDETDLPRHQLPIVKRAIQHVMHMTGIWP